jgi:hypothetical protein
VVVPNETLIAGNWLKAQNAFCSFLAFMALAASFEGRTP